MADFSAWSNESLIKFANEAQLKILQQEQQIEHLRQDLKDAIAAYRDLMRKDESPGGR